MGHLQRITRSGAIGVGSVVNYARFLRPMAPFGEQARWYLARPTPATAPK